MQRLASLVFPLTLIACGGSSSSDGVTRSQYDATASAIATASAGNGNGGDTVSMRDTVDIALGVPSVGLTLSGDGHFQGTVGSLAFTYGITCEDANGVSLSVCGATTDSAAVDVSWSGSLTTSVLSTSVSRTGHWSVSGLQGDTATFDGDSSFSFDATIGSLAYSFDAAASYDAVLVDTDTHEAIGGSASWDVTATTNNHSFEVHADLTFSASHTASLVLDGDQKYTLDLSTGIVARVN